MTSSTTGPGSFWSGTGLVIERGGLGVWLIGQAGAFLVVPGGRRVYCFCVRTTDPELPSADRIAHLLLALRTDERGFATVANLAFSGAPWRVRRRLKPSGSGGRVRGGTRRPHAGLAAGSLRGRGAGGGAEGAALVGTWGRPPFRNFVPGANAGFSHRVDHRAMTNPASSAKLLLVEDRRSAAAASDGVPVRRFRIARLRVDGRPRTDASRYEHLKRVYD